MRPHAQSGQILLEALIAAAVVSAIVMGVYELYSRSSEDYFRLTQRTQVNTIVARVGNDLQTAPMLDVMNACQSEITSGASRCVGGDGKLLGNLAAHTSDISFATLWKTPLDWNGGVTDVANARVCVELTRCRPMLKSQLWDLQLQVWWWSNTTYKSQYFTFRRAM